MKPKKNELEPQQHWYNGSYMHTSIKLAHATHVPSNTYSTSLIWSLVMWRVTIDTRICTTSEATTRVVTSTIQAACSDPSLIAFNTPLVEPMSPDLPSMGASPLTPLELWAWQKNIYRVAVAVVETPAHKRHAHLAATSTPTDPTKPLLTLAVHSQINSRGLLPKFVPIPPGARMQPLLHYPTPAPSNWSPSHKPTKYHTSIYQQLKYISTNNKFLSSNLFPST